MHQIGRRYDDISHLIGNPSNGSGEYYEVVFPNLGALYETNLLSLLRSAYNPSNYVPENPWPVLQIDDRAYLVNEPHRPKSC